MCYRSGNTVAHQIFFLVLNVEYTSNLKMGNLVIFKEIMAVQSGKILEKTFFTLMSLT
jgi:uncharacterized protein YydD (DUF2326 family)